MTKKAPALRFSRSGITLVEVVLASVVMAFVVAGGMRVLAAVVARRETAVRVAVGSQLGDQMLAEAMSRPFTCPGIARNSEFGPSTSEQSGAGWGSFDDCDDFEGWTSTPPVNSTGVALEGFDVWTRRVDVSWVTLSEPTVEVSGPTPVKRIRVDVEYLGKHVATRIGYRTEAGQRTVEAR